jgi:predicted  nucleic acid-binding Zn ribbon protein
LVDNGLLYRRLRLRHVFQSMEQEKNDWQTDEQRCDELLHSTAVLSNYSRMNLHLIPA